jgi:hypothetical protein
VGCETTASVRAEFSWATATGAGSNREIPAAAANAMSVAHWAERKLQGERNTRRKLETSSQYFKRNETLSQEVRRFSQIASDEFIDF